MSQKERKIELSESEIRALYAQGERNIFVGIYNYNIIPYKVAIGEKFCLRWVYPYKSRTKPTNILRFRYLSTLRKQKRNVLDSLISLFSGNLEPLILQAE